MTLEELCKKYDVSENTIKTNFKRFSESVRKKTGVIITKEGKGKKAIYKEEIIDNRALTMYEETKENFIIDRSALSYESIEFNVFLAIVVTQFMTFRGTYKELLRYMALDVSPKNLIVVKQAMESLAKRNIIHLYYDKSAGDLEEYVVASLLRKAEVEMKIGIDMVKTCKRIADASGKRDYIVLLKTWLGLQIASEDQPFTIAQLVATTGLSEYQIRTSKKLLEKDDLFRTSRAYKISEGVITCLGQNIELNAFYN